MGAVISLLAFAINRLEIPGSRQHSEDPEHGDYLCGLDASLAPGDSPVLNFELAYRSREIVPTILAL
ncbi:MAG: hypothetical protein KDH97_14870 [Calditrichaeota bacterium]|nr:hypothetical protein [Calditrichota bacterium]MCB0291535.1 hypothetical protein [Calditrichota bacterium]